MENLLGGSNCNIAWNGMSSVVGSHLTDVMTWQKWLSHYFIFLFFFFSFSFKYLFSFLFLFF